MSFEHPCGALPVSGVSIAAWYCWEHQAWWASAYRYDQGDGDEVTVRDSASMRFGPFDDLTEVVGWLSLAASSLSLAVLAGDRPPVPRGR